MLIFIFRIGWLCVKLLKLFGVFLSALRNVSGEVVELGKFLLIVEGDICSLGNLFEASDPKLFMKISVICRN